MEFSRLSISAALAISSATLLVGGASSLADLPSMDGQVNPDAINKVKLQQATTPDIQAESITFSRLKGNMIRATGTIRNIGADQPANANSHQINLSTSGSPTQYTSLTAPLRRNQTATVMLDIPAARFVTSGKLQSQFNLCYVPEPDTASRYDGNSTNNCTQVAATP